MQTSPWPLSFLRRHAVVMIGVAVIFLIVGGLGLTRMRTVNPSLVRSPIPMICTNPDCAKTFSRKPRTGDRPTCSACGTAAVPARKCPGCGNAIVLNGYIGQAGPTVCPHCRKEISHEE